MLHENSKEWFPVFHVPHDGNLFPPDLMESVSVPMDVFMAFHEHMRDKLVGELIPNEYRGPEHVLRFGISRLLCDVERFIGPDEIMERFGMGFCYERAYDGTVIKHVTDRIREKTLAYYHAWHERLDDLCFRYPRILLLDIHSYSEDIVPAIQIQQGRSVPDVCIGADDRFTPPELIKAMRDGFRNAGLYVAENYPYSGCMVPNAVLSGRSACDCASIMLEINKRAYLPNRREVDLWKAKILRMVIENAIRQIT